MFNVQHMHDYKYTKKEKVDESFVDFFKFLTCSDEVVQCRCETHKHLKNRRNLMKILVDKKLIGDVIEAMLSYTDYDEVDYSDPIVESQMQLVRHLRILLTTSAEQFTIENV